MQYNFRSERSLAENRLRYYLIFTKNKKVCIGGSKGGVRDEPSQGPNSFIFMQFSAKNCKIIPTWELAYPLRKILDPPLVCVLQEIIFREEPTAPKVTGQRFVSIIAKGPSLLLLLLLSYKHESLYFILKRGTLLVADPRAALGTPSPRSKFFHFHAVFGKCLKNNIPFGSWCSLWEILHPPLISFCNIKTKKVDQYNIFKTPSPSN